MTSRSIRCRTVWRSRRVAGDGHRHPEGNTASWRPGQGPTRRRVAGNTSTTTAGRSRRRVTASASSRLPIEERLRDFEGYQVLLKSVTHRDTRVRGGLCGYAFAQVRQRFDALTRIFRNAPSALTRRRSQVRGLQRPQSFSAGQRVDAVLAVLGRSPVQTLLCPPCALTRRQASCSGSDEGDPFRGPFTSISHQRLQ